MRKRVIKIVLSTLALLLVIVLIIAVRLWFYFRSPEAMERMGWDHADSVGSCVIVKPGGENFTDKCIFGIQEDYQFRLYIDCEIKKGTLVIETFKIKDYEPQQRLSVSEEQKELIERIEIKESCENYFDFEKYEVGNYLLFISWEGEDAELTCDWALKQNMYVWQSRYNSFIFNYPWVGEKFGDGYGFGDFVDD